MWYTSLTCRVEKVVLEMKNSRTGNRLTVYQKVIVKLKVAGKLPDELMNTVEPLKEDGTALVQVDVQSGATTAIGKLVAKLEPLALNQHLETVNGAVVGVKHQLRQGDHLRRAIPAIGAVHQHWSLVDADRLHNDQSSLYQRRQVVKPLAIVEQCQPTRERERERERGE